MMCSMYIFYLCNCREKKKSPSDGGIKIRLRLLVCTDSLGIIRESLPGCMQIIKESFVGQRGLFHADVAGVPVLSYIPSVDVCEECQKMLSGTFL